MTLSDYTKMAANKHQEFVNRRYADVDFRAGVEWERQRDKSIAAIPYQKCPVCDGNGQVFAGGTTSILYKTCDVCNGAKIIPMCPLPEPPKQKP